MSDKEELSKEEIDDLLNSLDDEDVSEQIETSENSEGDEEESNLENIRIYDFIRPQFLNQQELELLQGRLNKKFQDSCARFSAATGSEISSLIESVDILTLHEYTRILPNPCAVVKAFFPSGNYLSFEVSLPAAHTMKNLLLGIEKVDSIDDAFSPDSAAVFSAPG